MEYFLVGLVAAAGVAAVMFLGVCALVVNAWPEVGEGDDYPEMWGLGGRP